MYLDLILFCLLEQDAADVFYMSGWYSVIFF